MSLGYDPFKLLRDAIKAVPAVKYALGIGGIIGVLAIVRSFKIDPRVAALGTIVMLFLMMVLVIFAKAVGQKGSFFYYPALIFTWFCLLLFIATAGVLFGAIFFQTPEIDWSFITHASDDTPAERSSKQLEADGDSDAANGIYYAYCQWHTNCSDYGQAFLPSRAMGAWARAKLHWQDARDSTNNSKRFNRLKDKLNPNNSVSCKSDPDRRKAFCEAKSKGADDLKINAEILSALRPDTPEPSNAH